MRRDAADVPIPVNGLKERVWCGLRARYGYWCPDARACFARYFGGRTPARLEQVVARLEALRPWETCAHGVNLIEFFCLECAS